jgi:hypothetical protein
MTRKSQKAQDEYLRDHVMACWQDAEQATEARRTKWNELWRAFKRQQDTSGKRSWQSQVYVPKVWMHVKRATAEIRRAMLKTGKLFKFELDDATERARMARLQEIFRRSRDANEMGACKEAEAQLDRDLKQQQATMDLDERRFKSDLQRTNLARVYSETAEVAFLLGVGVTKLGWNRRENRTAYKNVDPFNYGVAPDWEPTSDEPPEYQIERDIQRLARFRSMAEQANADSGEAKPWNIAALKQIEHDYLSGAAEQQDERRGISRHLRDGKKLEALHWWGDVPKEDHSGYQRTNRYVVIANGRHVVRNAPNPFAHAHAPYILTMPLAFPFRGHSGDSLVEPIVPLSYSYNQLFNLFLDNLNFTVNKMFQIDPNLLATPQGMTAVYPGKIWRIKPGLNNAAQAVRDIPVAAVGGDALRALELMAKEMQEGDSVTEFLAGMPGSKAKTATEIETKTMESRGLFDVIARELEQFSLCPILEMSYDLYEQFAGYTPRQDKYHILVDGVSLLMQAKAMGEAIAAILGMVFKFGQVLVPLTDVPHLWRSFLSVHNLTDAYREPQDQRLQPTFQQKQDIAGQAEADARRLVAGMTPEQREQLMQGAGGAPGAPGRLPAGPVVPAAAPVPPAGGAA